MLREKQLEDRKLRPQIDSAAAGRFIKHGLYDKKNEKKRLNHGNNMEFYQDNEPKNKKIKFPENDSD